MNVNFRESKIEIPITTSATNQTKIQTRQRSSHKAQTTIIRKSKNKKSRSISFPNEEYEFNFQKQKKAKTKPLNASKPWNKNRKNMKHLNRFHKQLQNSTHQLQEHMQNE